MLNRVLIPISKGFYSSQRVGSRFFSTINSESELQTRLNALQSSHGEVDFKDVEKYFQSKFRKISVEESIPLLEKCADVEALDKSFWVWETLEEALRPKISAMNDDQVDKVSKAFARAIKGSDHLWDEIEHYIIVKHTKLFK